MYNKSKFASSAVLLVLIFVMATGCEGSDGEASSQGHSQTVTTTAASEGSSSVGTDVSPEDLEGYYLGEEDFSEPSEYAGEIDESITRIAQAYLQKDTGLLTDTKEIKIYKECKRLIGLLVEDGMSDYEKELAIHNYIITHAHYDLDELSILKEVSEDSFTPYGILFNQKGVCLGYTRTFQLFMDMLEIDCITIHSTAYENEEHAWNMVRLDNRWYHVDVTWDDPIPDGGDEATFMFFNVTDEDMEYQHQWDKTKFPRADSTAYNYYVMKELASND